MSSAAIPRLDDSSATILIASTGEEVASFADKLELTIFARHCDKIGPWDNTAALMNERNNHGHAGFM